MRERRRETSAADVHAFVEAAAKSRYEVYLGIDPGAEGAIGLVCGKHHAVIDIPTYTVEKKVVRKNTKKMVAETGKKSRRIVSKFTKFDYDEIFLTFGLLRPIKGKVHTCLEEAQVMVKGKGANAFTGYRVGCGYAMWPLFLLSRNFASREEVNPAEWKLNMGLHNKSKDAVRHVAIGLFPKAPLETSSDHNRAEALLLAEYLRRKRNGT
jgi:hypothetical protein